MESYEDGEEGEDNCEALRTSPKSWIRSTQLDFYRYFLVDRSEEVGKIFMNF